ncbi:MAG TPA: hypothetical protein DEG17_21920 [Cyanobacteria bacterium UBA11149]|nr:hypothetical protein [Cyanobacteria bacterium UBA11367]HBE57075.1 hypothetical protein [Cyanobacteria bacterium UBA11366]HBK62819.1 hypothetical protein [Cyanobacteria bacterium UBA11166]HBR74469.1 hypothetical protein [Cyanobacteria bacterium UBA11159]HBS70119.1 hypothetical protein [Cyanobacteria bacterium UBA11153]HBW91443.1 hypothetical protein [Cyanobacteria bacterium UBA11149]HCA95556.1 hypothetical protein [Cyanobacteria bacterium UBA9226]
MSRQNRVSKLRIVAEATYSSEYSRLLGNLSISNDTKSQPESGKLMPNWNKLSKIW